MADRQGIIIRFGAAIADFVTGKNRVKDELKDLDKSVTDVGDTGEDSTRKTVDGLKDVERAAGDASSATDDLGDSTEKASTKGGGLIDTLKGGLLSIAGVAGGVAGIVQTVLGKAIDAVTTAINNQIKAADEMKKAIVTAYQEAGAAGDVYLTKAQVTANALAIINDPLKNGNAQRDAAAIGIDASTYIRAQAGDYEALKTVIEATKRAQDELDKRPPAPADYEARAQQQKLNLIEAQNVALQNLHDQGIEDAKFTIQVTNDIAAADQDRIAKTKQADQERYEAAAEHIAALESQTVTIPIDLDTTKAEKTYAALKKRFTTGDGIRVPIVADIAERFTRDVP